METKLSRLLQCEKTKRGEKEIHSTTTKMRGEWGGTLLAQPSDDDDGMGSSGYLERERTAVSEIAAGVFSFDVCLEFLRL